jgi:hypothetical protein
MESSCPECGADWSREKSCEEAFYQMEYWEIDHGLLEVHHLMVLCYYLQHPSLYSPDGLRESKRLLLKFLEGGLTPQQAVQQNHGRLNSSVRKFKIKGTPDSHGAYGRPVRWTMTDVDVVNRGIEAYYDSVREWAKSVLETLRVAGEI